MHDSATIKNAKGDNSQVFCKKNSSNTCQKEIKGKQENLKRLRKYECDDVSLKLVPLHIYDVINALRHIKESSNSALRSKHKIKLKHPNKGKISHRVKKFYYSDDTSQVSDDKRSVISDFVEELNLRYIRKCESEMRRARRIKRRRAVGHHFPRKWSQSQIRHYMRQSEKNCSRNKRHSWSTRSFRSDGRSSFTLLSFVSPEQVENQINIEKMRLGQKDINSGKNKQDSSKKDKKRRGDLDYDESLILPEGDSLRGRGIRSKSYTINKEVYSNSSKEKKQRERTREKYISRSQEDTYKALAKRGSLRKNRNQEHGRKDKVYGRKERSKLTKKNSGSTDGQRDKHRVRSNKVRKSKKEKHSSKPVRDEQDRKDANNEDQAGENTLDKMSTKKVGNDSKTLSGKSLIDFSEKSYKRDYMENNHHTFTNPIQSLNQRILAENYQRIMMSDSDIPNFVELGTENGDTGAKKVSESGPSRYSHTKVGTNTGKHLQINERTSHLRKSEVTLLPQNSKIIFKIDTNQLQKMNIMVGDSRSYGKSSKKSIDQMEKDHLTDSCSLNIIPSDTFNKRYKKNRLNNNFGILSRISVPEFHQKEILSKHCQNLKGIPSRCVQKESSEKRPNNPLRNMLLTQIVRQNSSLSLKDEGKLDLKKTYMFNELSSDMYSQPQNISDLYSTDQTPNLAPLSDPLSTLVTDTEGNYITPEVNKWRGKQRENLQADDDSDSEVTESLIVATMSRRQLRSTKPNHNPGKTTKSRKQGQDSEETESQSSEPGTFYQRSGHPCNERRKIYRPGSVRSRVTCRSFPRSIWRGKNKNSSDKKQRIVSEKSDTSNEENLESRVHHINEKRHEGIAKTGRKCAVRGCNKAAVVRTERITETNERNQAEDSSHCQNQKANEISGHRKKCTHRTGPQKTDKTNTKTCVLCTAPLMDRNIAKGLPPNEHLMVEDNFKLLDNLCMDETVPFFRSPSQEDFQNYINRMKPCSSAFHHTSQATTMKKYHSSPIANPLAIDYNPNKFITQPSHWDPEFCFQTGYDFQCMTSGPSCAHHPFGDTDTLAYYCTENTSVLDPPQMFDYSAPNSEFEPFPFMQSAGPLMDMNGRPLLILDNEGQPILDYTGEPIIPETYVQVEGPCPYDPQCQINNSLQSPPIQNTNNQTGKLSRFFGFR